VHHLNQSEDRPATGAAQLHTRSGGSCGVLGVGWDGVAGPESREAAGLVLFKTTPEQTSSSSSLHRENDLFRVNFCPSERSLKRIKKLKSAVWLSGQFHCHTKNGHRPDVPWFVTLTYRFADKWEPNHIADAMDRFRSWCDRKRITCRYIWVAEIQPKRAERTGEHVVHYHLIAWLPPGVKMTFWDRPRVVKGKKTVAFWSHGSTKTEVAKHGVSYLMKYLSKMGEFTRFPPGLRLYGVGGLDAEQRSIRAWGNLPHWVKCSHGVGDVRRVRGRLVDQSTGELLPPMFARKLFPGGIELRLLRPYPDKIFDHGAFSSWPRP
jgi:hypothetical protein